MKNKNLFKYLVSSERDLLWGLIVDNVGQAEISKDYKIYPPQVGHPTDYYFTPQNGRILDNYQLIYISKGNGTYFISPNEGISITTGDMLIIAPYTWHSYYPDKISLFKRHTGYPPSTYRKQFSLNKTQNTSDLQNDEK